MTFADLKKRYESALRAQTRAVAKVQRLNKELQAACPHENVVLRPEYKGPSRTNTRCRTMTKSLKDYQREAHALAKEKGFYDNVPNPFDHVWIGARLALIHAELSEALEELCEWGFTVCDTTGEKPEGFGIELADVLLRVFDLAESLNLNLDELVELKHCYNKSRAYKHGKKL